MTQKKRKIIIFGAGKIGRSFIGQLFSAGNFEVVFIDISSAVINELNYRREYQVIIKSEKEEIIQIKNVRGVNALNKEQVVEEINCADIMAVSVGAGALPHIMPIIAEGLKKRYNRDKKAAIDIIIAENMRNVAPYFHDKLMDLLPPGFPLEQFVGLVETSIGKMVPIMPKKLEQEDVLLVFAEPYNTLILDKKAFKNPVPEIEGLAPKENMKAWVDRKLFIHNLGHATAAYLGYYYNPGFRYLWEVLEDPQVYLSVRETMLQAARILLKKYPDEFTIESLTEHVDDLLIRFQNKALGDTIYRVGCDLLRKLGPDDRIVGAIRLALSINMPYDKILNALLAGFHFRAKDEDGNMHPNDIEFLKIYKKGIPETLKTVCGFDDEEISLLLTNNEAVFSRYCVAK